MTKEHSLDEIEAIIKRATADYGPDAAAALRAHAMWALQRRPTQTPPPGDWTVWLLLAGRGFGKTRTAAETLRDWAWEAPRTRWLLSAPTWADIDKTCFNGESGLLAVIPEEMIAKARQDDFTIELTNGSIIQSISAEKPERFRGPQFHGGWCCVAATLVTMADGTQRRIDAVRRGDMVLTPAGPRRVTAASRTQIGARIWRLRTVHGRELRATADHLVAAGATGYIPFSELEAGECLTVWSSNTEDCAGARGRTATSSMTPSVAVGACVSSCTAGSTPTTMVRSPRASTSITGTRTRPTTTSGIWRCSATPSTSAGTPSNPIWADGTQPPRRLPCWRTGPASVTCETSLAWSAGVGSAAASIAPLLASVRRPVRTADATASSPPPRRAPASSAARSSRPIGAGATGAPALVSACIANDAVLNVQDTGLYEDVYDLTIEGEHQFFANGILVHNCDELAAWQYAEEAWDLMMLGMRLGRHPRIIASTTPKPRPLIRRLVLDKHTVVTYGSTRENLGNLAPTIQRELMKYEGTRYGRQEIEGELIDPEEAGIIKRSWLKLWPATKPLPALTYIIISLDTAFTEKTIDKKTNDPDPTACSVWGLFKDKERWGILLLDCWEDWLGMPDLIRRCKKEMEVRYGDDEMRATIKPAFGSAKPLEMGKTPDLLLIEEKGSGISLRQMLSREGIVTYPYNPGKADKLQRLHAVSHIFAGGYVWVLESKKNPGQPRAWADPLISQLCSFAGEGSVKHDDYVDSTTQAIRYLADAARMSVENPKLPEDDPVPRREVVNPYGV